MAPGFSMSCWVRSEAGWSVFYISPPFPGFAWRKRAAVRHTAVDVTSAPCPMTRTYAGVSDRRAQSGATRCSPVEVGLLHIPLHSAHAPGKSAASPGIEDQETPLGGQGSEGCIFWTSQTLVSGRATAARGPRQLFLESGFGTAHARIRPRGRRDGIPGRRDARQATGRLGSRGWDGHTSSFLGFDPSS